MFSERIAWGRTESIDEASRTLRVAADLPADLPARPTAAELAAQREKEWEEWRNRPSDWDREPKKGEDFYDWALRVIKGGNPFAAKAALTQLRLRDPEPDKLEDVSKVLIATLSDSRNLEEHVEAMLVWRTEATEKAILALGGSHEAWVNSEPLMNALVKLGSRNAARALASGLNDFFVGEKVVSRLIEIGPVAEEFVLPFLDHTDARVRRRAYTVLAEIGGRKSLSRLRSNIGKERDEPMKSLARSTHETAKERADAADAAEKDEKDGSKPAAP
ncbi:MAG TPA: HEAT repeat domain-containing protein [Planctomycetaceae bacterium]|nr:HEAT repeat domain-containing protein [Planctomycetaceae bacterium]